MRFMGIFPGMAGAVFGGVVFVAAADAQTRESWMSRAMGQYGGRIISGAGPLPSSVELDFTSGGAIEGEYGFSEHGERVMGRLDACTVTRPFAIACRWHDRNGDGALEMVFGRELNSFVGRWNTDAKPDFWRSWFGRKFPSI